jgi:hypothetical protein
MKLKLLYKYCPPNRLINILEDNHIRYTQASSLNDPFEVLPYIKSIVNKSQFSKFDKLVSQENKEFDDKFLKENMSILESIFTEPTINVNLQLSDIFRNEFDKKYGILCLTKNFKNIVMWSQYSKDHTGFMIGFNDNLWNSKFNNFNALNYKQLFQVQYTSKRPNYDSFINDEIFNIDGIDTFFKTILTTKSTQWKMENEYRIIADTKGAILTHDQSTDKNPIYLFEIPPSYISLIVLGKNFKEPNFDYMNILSKSEYSHIKLFKSELDAKKYKLNYIELK